MPLKLRDGVLVSTDDVQPQSADSVRLVPEDDALSLRDQIESLACVEVSYPVYTDGRGHSQARLLRERLGFEGEIRAVGDVRLDQVAMMLRCGINAFDCADPEQESRILATGLAHPSKQYDRFYQS